MHSVQEVICIEFFIVMKCMFMWLNDISCCKWTNERAWIFDRRASNIVDRARTPDERASFPLGEA